MAIRSALSSSRFELDPSQNRRFVQYLLVGLVGVGINQGTLFVATGLAGLSYLLGGFLGQVVSLSINYAINDRWTWAEYGEPGVGAWMWRGIKYGGTRVVGVAIHLVTLTVLVELFHVHYLLANLVAIGAGVFWGFGASDVLIWQTSGGPSIEGRIRTRLRNLHRGMDRSTRYVLVLTVLMFLGFSTYTILLYRSFWMTGGDFGSYVHAFETTRQGVGFLHTGRYRIGNPTSAYWGEHFSLTLLAVYPIYWLLPYQETLLVVKSAALALSIPLLWLVAREHLSTGIATFTVVLYALNPFLHSAWLFDFQEQMFLPALLFGAYYCYLKRRHALFLLLVGATLLTNEFLVFIVGGALFGFVLATYRSDSRGWRDDGPMLLGMAVLVVATHLLAGIVIARYNQFSGIPVTAVAEVYRPFVESQRVGSGELLSIVASNPMLAWESVTTDMMTKVTYFVLFLVPVAFVSMFDEISLFSVAPYLGFAWVFSGAETYYVFAAHYPLYLLPFVFIGAVRVIGKFSHRRESRKLIKRIFLVVMVLSVLISVSGGIDRQAVPGQSDHFDTLSAAMDSIPEDATLVTQNDLYPHVADRPHALFIASAPTYYEYETTNDVDPPEYILFDTELATKPLDWSKPVHQSYREELGSDYGLYRYEDGVWVFKRGYEGEIQGITTPYRQPSKSYGLAELRRGEAVVYDNKIESTSGIEGDIVWFGPYESLPRGTYDVTFLVNVGASAATLEVTEGYDHDIVARKEVGETDGWEEITLTVMFEEFTSNIEFRGKRETRSGAVSVRRVYVGPG